MEIVGSRSRGLNCLSTPSEWRFSMFGGLEAKSATCCANLILAFSNSSKAFCRVFIKLQIPYYNSYW